VISGTPTAAAVQSTYTVTASGGGGSTSFPLVLTVDPGPAVHLAALATDAQGHALTFQWRTTDGVLLNVNGNQADWLLASGPGLHFAYVLVSNGNGGYTERRLAVNTDTIGKPIVASPAQLLAAPPAPPPPAQAHAYRIFIDDTGAATFAAGGGTYFQRILLPDVFVKLKDLSTGATFPATGALKSDSSGQVVIPNVPALTQARIDCSVNAGVSFFNCNGTAFNNFRPGVTLTGAVADTNYASADPPLPSWMTPVPPFVEVGYSLSDGSPCGITDPLFAVDVTATATLLDATGKVVTGPVRFNNARPRLRLFGAGTNLTVQLNCEGVVNRTAGVTTAPQSGTPGVNNNLATLTTGSTRPTISNMTATLAGQSVGTFLPPPTGFPSDNTPANDFFLAYKGVDSRQGACQYYKAIGAVRGCDATGNLIGPVSFDDWQRSIKIGSHAIAGATEYAASYINLWDLNLTRRHHSISYGPGQTAAYVCNHLGPPFDATQAQVDTAIDNAVAGKNLVACVAMDDTVTPGVNGGRPFVRFLIFGPNGQLLPSINLDGRAEKFVPGTCVACHGGDNYAGAFPEDGSGFADIGAHFLPYDTANFAFSSKPGLTEADQSDQIYNLNQNVLKANPTRQEQELIAGWYPGGTHTLNKLYVAPGWATDNGLHPPATYLGVYGHSCRGCHIAMVDRYNFEDSGFTTMNGGVTTCGYSPGSLQQSPELNRWNSMPNSLVTFNRFWGSRGTAADQPVLINAYLGGPINQLTCRLLPH
jgi:hypothetical protein